MIRSGMRLSGEGRPAVMLWLAAAATALGLHAAVLAALIRAPAPDQLTAGGGDAITVELDPVEGETDKAAEAEPAKPAEEATTASTSAADAAASPAVAQAPTPVTPPPPDPAPQPPSPEAPSDVRPTPPEPPQPSTAPPPPAEATPDLALTPPPSPSEAASVPRPAPPQPVTPPTPASQASAAAAETEDASPAQRRLSAAREAAWRGKLVPHLNHYRRFPAGLHAGTARIGFTVDGAGHVTAVAVVASSGDAALDAAARDLVSRASPFPAPPPGTAGRDLSFVVPVHYDTRRP